MYGVGKGLEVEFVLSVVIYIVVYGFVVEFLFVCNVVFGVGLDVCWLNIFDGFFYGNIGKVGVGVKFFLVVIVVGNFV